MHLGVLGMPEGASKAPLSFTAVLEGGERVPLELDAYGNSVLRNRSQDHSAAIPTSSLRFLLPASTSGKKIASLEVASSAPTVISLQQVDVLGSLVRGNELRRALSRTPR